MAVGCNQQSTVLCKWYIGLEIEDAGGHGVDIGYDLVVFDESFIAFSL